MSLIGMTDEYIRFQVEGRPPRRRLRPLEETPDDEQLLREDVLPASAGGDALEYLRKLIEYIPAESIAIYTAGLPWATPASASSSFTGRWVLAGGVLALTPLFTASYYALSVRKHETEFRWPWMRIAVACIAFSTWIFALPDSPFGDFDFYDPKQGSFVVILVSAVIAAAARFTSLLDPPSG